MPSHSVSSVFFSTVHLAITMLTNLRLLCQVPQRRQECRPALHSAHQLASKTHDRCSEMLVLGKRIIEGRKLSKEWRTL